MAETEGISLETTMNIQSAVENARSIYRDNRMTKKHGVNMTAACHPKIEAVEVYLNSAHASRSEIARAEELGYIRTSVSGKKIVRLG